jgi:ribosomal protein S19
MKNEKHKSHKDMRNYHVYIFNRASLVPRCFSGLYVYIHKGKSYRRIIMHDVHRKFKFGEFSFTRKLYFYPLKKKHRR